MRKKNTRLTRSEIDACISALEFCLAGLDDGSGMGFERDEAERFAEAAEAAEAASAKLKERLDK